jgi:glutamate racemase
MTIGIFDSGVGGLSVLFPLLELLPNQSVLYAADQAFCPYGPRPANEIRDRSFAVTHALLDLGASPIVVACNTATSVALTALRERWPDVPLVGMEPAVKPAAERTRTGHVGVLATAATARSERLARLIDRFGRNVSVHVHVPTGLVELIEAGLGESDQAAALLAPTLHRWAALGVDAIVLGCTHYPFARATIERLVGPTVEVIDPAPAVARRTVEVLRQTGGATRRAGVTFLTTADPGVLEIMLHRLAPSLAATATFGSLHTTHAPHLRSA